MMNRNLQGAIECRILVIAYANALAKQLATGDIPSRMDVRNPNSSL